MQAKTQEKVTSYEQAKQVLNTIFTQILPKHGCTIREKQIELANEILETIDKQAILLSEAGTGIGKTHAYIIAATIAKYAHINDIRLSAAYPELGISALSKLPIVISTSSIALQIALVKEYIPKISRLLLEYKLISSLLSAVVRKGREHYICEKRLRAYMRFEKDTNIHSGLVAVADNDAVIDIAEVDGITAHIKGRIGVFGRCDGNCEYRETCRYMRFRDSSQSDRYDFQICNHNYLLVDTLRRSQDQAPLIPNYQTLIIDEGHKFVQAAQQIYGVGLADNIIPSITDEIFGAAIQQTKDCKEIIKITKKLLGQHKRLFRFFNESVKSEPDEDTERFSVEITDNVLRHFKNICNISDTIAQLLANQPNFGGSKGVHLKILQDLARLKERVSTLRQYKNMICWLEKSDENSTFFVIPNNLSDILHKDLWSKKLPNYINVRHTCCKRQF